jgi:hypothetical protein
MDEASLQFHIEEDDYFGTLGTVLDLVSQDLREKGDFRNAKTILSLRDDLMYLQRGYRIEKIEPIAKDQTAIMSLAQS